MDGSAAPIIIDSLDHLVLTVADIDATCRFYVDILGMQLEQFGHGRTALRFGDQKSTSTRPAPKSSPTPPIPSPAPPTSAS